MALSVCDVTAPGNAPGGAALSPLTPNNSSAGATNTSRLQAIVNAFCTNSATAKEIHFPIGIYYFSSGVTFPNANGISITGSGGLPKGLNFMIAGTGAWSLLRLTPTGTGPIFQFQNSDGVFVERLVFDGGRNPDHNDGSNFGVNPLIGFNANIGGFFHKFHCCGFYRFQRGFWAQESADSGPAEITFDKCIFNAGEGSATKWTSEAFFTDENQCVNTMFTNCEWNNCGICVSTENLLSGNGPGGRFNIRDATITICGLILKVTGGGQNVDGHLIESVHLDGQFPPRLRLYKSITPTGPVSGMTAGNVVIRQVKYGTLGSLNDEFARISSFNGTVLTLTDPLRMAIGDKVAFVPTGDLDTKANKVTATIVGRTSDFSYTTSFAGGVSAGTHYCICDEALIEAVDSDFVTFEDSFLTYNMIRNGRLARLTSKSANQGRTPKFICKRCTGFLSLGHSQATLENLLTMGGSGVQPWWRFEDADGIDSSFAGAPLTVGNFGITSGGSSGGGSTTTIIGGESEMHVSTKYNQNVTIPIVVKSATTGQPLPGISWASGDTFIIKDNNPTATTILNPVPNSNGVYTLTLVSTDTQFGWAKIVIRDQDTTPVFAPLSIQIDTYGNVLARHEFDLDNPKVGIVTDGLDANALKLDAIHKMNNTPYDIESYSVDGAVPSPKQAALLTMGGGRQVVMNGTTYSVKKLDGVTDAATYITNDSANPTQIVRTG